MVRFEWSVDALQAAGICPEHIYRDKESGSPTSGRAWSTMVIVFATVRATAAEGAEARPGDDIVVVPDVVMDRAFTVPGGPATVWPWLVQLGKHRAGWYLPRRVERFLPRGRRAIRVLDPRWATLHVGDIVPDYGGRDETFTVAEIDPARHLVYWSRRGRAKVSWSIELREAHGGTRVRLRLRMAPIEHIRLARTAGEFIDALTVAGMAAGLRERLEDAGRRRIS